MNKNNPLKIIGAAIDCPNPDQLADFYAKMLGWTKTYSNEENAVVSSPTSSILLVFQAVENYQPPVWPWKKISKVK